MTDPLISVIIPTYNRGWILRDAIESVLNQDYKHFELIVVDDGSTDNTSAILSEYGNSILRIHQENRGVSAARNAGIYLAKGELIAFLDSDDIWLPKKLSVQATFFYSVPDAMICQTEEIWIRHGIRVNPKKKHQKLSGRIFEASLQRCLISPSAVMVRRKLFDDIGLFDERFPACEDYDLWLRVTSKYPVHLIKTPLIVKRGGHADQLSKEPGLDRYRIQSIHNILQSNNHLSDNERNRAIQILIEKCHIYIDGCLKRGKIDEAQFYMTLLKKYSLCFDQD